MITQVYFDPMISRSTTLFSTDRLVFLLWVNKVLIPNSKILEHCQIPKMIFSTVQQNQKIKGIILTLTEEVERSSSDSRISGGSLISGTIIMVLEVSALRTFGINI